MHTLVVAEKPSVARDIARVLEICKGQGRKQPDRRRLCGYGRSAIWLRSKEPQELDERYTRWRAEDLPILPEKMETR